MENSKLNTQPKPAVRGFFGRIAQWYKRNRLHLLVVVCILFLIFLTLFNRVFVTIAPGERGVIYRLFEGGTDTENVFGEGLHVIAPWDIMFRYPIRQQTITKCIHVLSTNGLSIDVELAVRFHPRIDSLGFLHAFLGPEYPRTVIIPEVESSTRKIISRFDPHEFYTIKRDSIESLVLEDTKSEFGSLHVVIHDIMLKDIILPQRLEASIEDKLVEEQRLLTYEFLIDAEREEEKRKLIEARGIRTFEDSSGISFLQLKGIDATQEIAKSENAKVVIVGTGEGDIPVILGGAD